MDNSSNQPGAGVTPRQHLTTREDVRNAIATLLEHAQRNVVVFGPVLDGYYFNTNRVADALGRFISQHHENRARFLIENGQQVVRDNARLIAMAKRFGDAIHIRAVGDDHVGLHELFIVADSGSYLYQENLDRLEGVAAYEASRDATPMARRFDGMWDMSQPVAGINSVGL